MGKQYISNPDPIPFVGKLRKDSVWSCSIYENKLIKQAYMERWNNRQCHDFFRKTRIQIYNRYLNHLDPTINRDPLTAADKRRILYARSVRGNKYTEIAMDVRKPPSMVKKFCMDYFNAPVKQTSSQQTYHYQPNLAFMYLLMYAELEFI